MRDTFTKDPDSTLDFVVDWSEWLPTGDTISSASWTVPAGITKESEANTTTTATVWLSGGTLGEDYACVCRITTAAGRIEDQTITIRVRAK